MSQFRKCFFLNSRNLLISKSAYLCFKLKRLNFKRVGLLQIIALFFQDGSGTISNKELLHVLRSIGQNPTEDEILELVMESDLNGDGTIDFSEFLEMMKRKSSETDQMEVK